MKTKYLIIAYLSTIMAASSAPVIGINFGAFNSWTTQAGGNSFGAIWTDVATTSGTGMTLTGTSATLDFQAGLTWPNNLQATGGSYTGTDGINSEISVFYNYLNDNGTQLTLNGLDTWLADEGASGYTITLYISSNEGTGFHVPTVGGTDMPVPILGNGTWNGSVEDPLGNSTVGIRGQATTGVLTDDSVTIYLPPWDSSTGAAARGGLAALVVTAVPEPATTGLSVLGVVTLVLLRRRRRH